MLDIYRLIRQLCPDINLELVTCNHPHVDWGWEAVEEIFNKVYWVSPEDYQIGVIERLGVFAQHFDLIDLQYHQSGALLKKLKRRYPKALLVFSPMESMIRAAMLYFQPATRRGNCRIALGLLWSAAQEISYVARADRVTCVSNLDEKALNLVKRKDVYCLPTALSDYEFTSFPSNSGMMMNSVREKILVFLAYFGSKTNRDALIWFVRYVHPLIRRYEPDYVLNVVGRGVDEELMGTCQVDGINFVGSVDLVEKELALACGGIAPALAGAGVRGKIHQYASVGLPCVTTNIAASGLKYEDGKSILIADSPGAFANQCLVLLKNSDLRTRIGQEAREVCVNHYTWRSMIKDVEAIYNLA